MRRIHTCKTSSICLTCLFKMQTQEFFKPLQNKSLSCNLGNLLGSLWQKNARLSFSVLCPPLAVLCWAVLALPASLPPVLPLSLSLAWLSLSQSQFCHPLAQNERDCSSLLSCFAHKSSQASDHFLCLFLPPPPLLPTLFYFIALHFISFHFWGNTAKLEHNIHGEGISLNDITALCYFQHYSQSHAFGTIWFSFLLQLPLWMRQIYS